MTKEELEKEFGKENVTVTTLTIQVIRKEDPNPWDKVITLYSIDKPYSPFVMFEAIKECVSEMFDFPDDPKKTFKKEALQQLKEVIEKL